MDVALADVLFMQLWFAAKADLPTGQLLTRSGHWGAVSEVVDGLFSPTQGAKLFADGTFPRETQ